MANESSVKVDLGISECIRAIDAINARRTERKENLLDDLCDNVEAIEKIVTTFDNIFIELVRGYTGKSIERNPTDLESLMGQTMDYLSGRELLPVLMELIGKISGFASDVRLKGRKYRELVSTLRDMEKRLDSFREQLGKGTWTGVGQANELNLMSLWEKANDSSSHGDYTLSELAEEVFRNHDFDLSDSIQRLAGKIKAHAKVATL